MLALPCSFLRNCTVRFFSFRHALSEYSKDNASPTVFCPIGDVGKGYTQKRQLTIQKSEIHFMIQ
jgi:hypothetical protein